MCIRHIISRRYCFFWSHLLPLTPKIFPLPILPGFLSLERQTFDKDSSLRTQKSKVSLWELFLLLIVSNQSLDPKHISCIYSRFCCFFVFEVGFCYITKTLWNAGFSWFSLSKVGNIRWMRRPSYGFDMLALVTEIHTKNQEHSPFKFIINSVFPASFLKRSLCIWYKIARAPFAEPWKGMHRLGKCYLKKTCYFFASRNLLFSVHAGI